MLTLFYSPRMTSVDNEARRASGHADVPLSFFGRQQAQELGQHYATEALDAILHSDLQRASTTAHIAFSWRGLPLIPDARLREYDYGDLTQCPTAQVEEEFPRRITEPFPQMGKARQGTEALRIISRAVSP
jgi:broad specificity phosphatase PhoE